MNFSKIGITEIEGFRLGNAENKAKGTGCTVIVCEDGAVGGVDVRGGGPATRETDLLRSENTVNAVNAVVLSGGSAFGLEAASGVMRELSDRDIGFKVGKTTVPIVCGASLFDLAVGDPKAFPDVEMGIEAVRNAFRGGFKNGNNGAGTGATVGKIKGVRRSMKTGLGTFACEDGKVMVGAVVAVNACGDVYNGAGNILAGLRSEHGDTIYGTIRALKGMVYDEVSKEKEEEKAAEKKPAKPAEIRPEDDPVLAKKKKDFSGVADALKAQFRQTSEIALKEIEERLKQYEQDPRPVKPEGSPEAAPEDIYLTMFEESKKEAPAKAAEAMRAPAPEAPKPAGKKPEAAPAPSEKKAEAYGDDDGLGYDIPFNTTIGCLITNAVLTKSQANKLASILHDAYARSIKPVHGTMDGDTIFVLSTCTQAVNFDAFAALATDVMQYAVIDGANSAKGAYGLPAARDM